MIALHRRDKFDEYVKRIVQGRVLVELEHAEVDVVSRQRVLEQVERKRHSLQPVWI